MVHFVYILYSSKLDKHYYGCTKELYQRLAKHNRATKGFTSIGKPWILVGYSMFDSISEARKFEQYLKDLKDHQLAKSKLDVIEV